MAKLYYTVSIALLMLLAMFGEAALARVGSGGPV